MREHPGRILTTHVGSLPRPQAVVDCLFAEDRGDVVDADAMERTLAQAVDAIVAAQARAGIDLVSDGEMSKISYATYIRHRLTGFAGDSPRAVPQDIDDIPDYRDRLVRDGASAKYLRPICQGPVTVKDLAPAGRDVARMKAALAARKLEDGFLNAASPGTIAVFQPNEYYPTQQAYLEALAEAMRSEYRLIVESGLMLQVDCPDLAMGRHVRFRGQSEEIFVAAAARQVEALNHALEGLPAERIRLHVCWGNYEGPHTCDIDLVKLLPILFQARAGALLIEGANPRHEHEWEVWREYKLPDDKILVPGVLDTSCNFVEHPRLIAQRLLRYADLVGRERIQAGTDCGFGTFAGFGPVHPQIAWLKLESLVEGARIASDQLWGKAA